MLRIDANEFLRVVRPTLEQANWRALSAVVKSRWRAHDIAELLRHERKKVRQTAAVVLGVVGDMHHTDALARALRDEDLCVNQMADFALWHIWMRSGGPESSVPFNEGCEHMETGDYEAAAKCLTKAIAINPDFAQAHFQLANALYMLGDFERSRAACCETLKRVPQHFSALACIGHCFLELGDIARAVTCYRKALQINPHLTETARALAMIEAHTGESWDIPVDELEAVTEHVRRASEN